MSILIYHKDYVLHKDCHHSEPCLGCLILRKVTRRIALSPKDICWIFFFFFFLPNIPNQSEAQTKKIIHPTKTKCFRWFLCFSLYWRCFWNFSIVLLLFVFSIWSRCKRAHLINYSVAQNIINLCWNAKFTWVMLMNIWTILFDSRFLGKIKKWWTWQSISMSLPTKYF